MSDHTREGGDERPLAGRVAVVTGASRNAGRGIAVELGAAGATVYVTGRSAGDHVATDLGTGTVDETARLVDEAGGEGVAVRCDHTDDGQVAALFERVAAERGGLDLLVNNVWGGYEGYDEEPFDAPFWEQPMDRYDRMFDAGVRAHFTASAHAAPLLGAGALVVNTTAWDRDRYLGAVPYDVAKHAVTRMVYGMALDLRERGVTVLALAPGWMRTEYLREQYGVDDATAHEHPDLARTESTRYVGRAVVALATDPDVAEKSGEVLQTGALAGEYDFVDVDGRRVPPFTLPSDDRLD
ncbi:SDR family oxidoreductase [Halomarina ordinaria]|uniref:SDR family oxidoreductase n=1 Tax=Halomarina ordinaria TaxID=3033939 RepID=A0ABD5UCM2_9EURY|nr:SDR family oxidoreductase [Halomarina sp. PSRA2]